MLGHDQMASEVPTQQRGTVQVCRQAAMAVAVDGIQTWQQHGVAPSPGLEGHLEAQRVASAALHRGPSGGGYGSSSTLCRGG